MANTVSWYWDKGNFREKNEDSFSVQRVKMNPSGIPAFFTKKGMEAAMLVVCDGIGGLPEGEAASGFAAEELTKWFYREGMKCMKSLFWQRTAAECAIKAFASVQKKLEQIEKEENVCCGTTCTMALVKGKGFVIVHIGDSRAYRIGGRERILTREHQEGGILRRCLGAFGFQVPDVLCGRLRKGEMLLLGTDGFYRFTDAGFFRGCFPKRASDASEYYRKLKSVGSFLRAQGEKDNMTAVLYQRG